MLFNPRPTTSNAALPAGFNRNGRRTRGCYQSGFRSNGANMRTPFRQFKFHSVSWCEVEKPARRSVDSNVCPPGGHSRPGGRCSILGSRIRAAPHTGASRRDANHRRHAVFPAGRFHAGLLRLSLAVHVGADRPVPGLLRLGSSHWVLRERRRPGGKLACEVGAVLPPQPRAVRDCRRRDGVRGVPARPQTLGRSDGARRRPVSRVRVHPRARLPFRHDRYGNDSADCRVGIAAAERAPDWPAQSLCAGRTVGWIRDGNEVQRRISRRAVRRQSTAPRDGLARTPRRRLVRRAPHLVRRPVRAGPGDGRSLRARRCRPVPGGDGRSHALDAIRPGRLVAGERLAAPPRLFAALRRRPAACDRRYGRRGGLRDAAAENRRDPVRLPRRVFHRRGQLPQPVLPLHDPDRPLPRPSRRRGW